jgi:hypothetical protein
MSHPGRRGAAGRLLAAVALAGAVLWAGCGDDPSGPGTLTATLVSPNGAEGSASIILYGSGLGAVSAIEGRVFSRHAGDTLRVVVVNPEGGVLRFAVGVDDVSRVPTAAALEVADTEDRLRTLAGYSVEVTR